VRPAGHVSLAQGFTLGLPVGAGAVALEVAKAASTPYPGKGYGRNPDVRILVVIDRCRKMKWQAVLESSVTGEP